MTQITVADLDNAKQDVDVLAAIVNSTDETVTDRMSNERRTIHSLSLEFPNASLNAAAAADSAAAAAAAESAAESARDVALLSRGVFETTGKALSKGVVGLTSLVGGSAGANGTFALAFSGGAGTGAAGVFTVSGGAVVSYNMTYAGDGYTSEPTVSFAASSGLTGASATAVIANNVDVGEYFSVPSPDAEGYIDLWRNNSGVADYQKTYPALAAINAILNMLRDTANVDGVALTDAGGFVFAALSVLGKLSTGAFVADGTGLVGLDGFKVTKDGLKFDDNTFLIYNANVDGLALTDAGGFIYLSVSSTGEYNYIGKPDPNAWTDIEIQTANASAASYSESVRQQSSPITPYPSTDWVVFVMYGQSLGVGVEGWPALSKTAKYGNKMYGQSVRPSSATATTFTPVGSNALYNLVGTTQDKTSFVLLDDVAVAALAQGDNAAGESPLESWVNGAKRLYNLSGGNPDRVFIGINCAVGGKSIAELSKGASPELYSRYVSAITGIKALADAASKTLSVHSVAYFQGERDYVLNTSLSSYKSALGQLQSDFIADAKAITGQVDSPLFMTYQTGGSYTNDTQDMAVGNAQLDASNEKNNYVLATPNYQVFDKGDHLDPNGYRWMGCQLAKVWEKLVLQRQGWKPLQPLSAQLKGKEILVNFHVPCPPLQFGLAWVGLQPFEGEGLTATDYVNKGFRVLDVDDNLQTISSVQIVADCVVKITLATAPTVDIKVLYGTKTSTDGNGNLMDSDASIADENYEYNVGTGQYSVANIPELLDKPYPLNNWCVAFTKTIEV